MLPATTEDAIWNCLRDVPDPEIPVVSVVDLGMVREVRVDGERIEVDVSPTYSGCPATEVIEESILRRLQDEGFPAVSIKRVLSPPWTTDRWRNAVFAQLFAPGRADPVGRPRR